MIKKLSHTEARKIYDPSSIEKDDSQVYSGSEGIVFQKRAVDALKFGLNIHNFGYNIYVSGPPGIGKMTAVKSFLEELAKQRKTPSDWIYVNNFDDQYQPNAIEVPPGIGKQLQEDIKILTEYFSREIPKAFESEEYNTKRDSIIRELNLKREKLYNELNDYAVKQGFVLQASKMGIMIYPVVGEKVLNENEFQALPLTDKEKIIEKRNALQEQMKKVFKEITELEKTTNSELSQNDFEIVLYKVTGMMMDLQKKYSHIPEIPEYLTNIQKDILNNINLLKVPSPQNPDDIGNFPFDSGLNRIQLFKKYQVNLIVDNSKLSGAPVVVELNPSYNQLFGKIEKENKFGNLITDYTMIRAGSLHNANRGYLVIPVDELLKNIYSWDALKRALQTKQIQIEELSERLGFTAGKSLRPEPLPLELKVILVGSPIYYYLLHDVDEEFSELFKVKADFETSIEATTDNTKDYTGFLYFFTKKENLKPLRKNAVAKILEYASTEAENQTKLSTKFGIITDIIKEANYWADEEHSNEIDASHISKTIREKIYRVSLIKDKIQEMIERGFILIDTAGKKTGQINGLSVLSLGDFSFGKPGRITSSSGIGKKGIIDIEREVKLGGPLHSKGVMILNGFITNKFSHNKSLSLNIHLVFEQSYEGIDGDSASSTELYAILSSLSGVPIKQGIAVTGSVNQYGEVQAIGGINEKIEGYFDICKFKGLTGEQGVMIPESNMINLMLREDIVEAIKNNQFGIWAVSTIDEGIEILTDVKAGEKNEKGEYPEGTIYYLVDKKLNEYNEYFEKNNKEENKP